MSAIVTLVPIGPVPVDLLSWLQQQLKDAFGISMTLYEQAPLPTAGYNKGRHQFQGGAIITCLRTIPSNDEQRVLGLVDVDCYSPGLNFIFGQTTLGDREAFVALARLRQSFYGLPEDNALFYHRVLKEAVHELGHTWGLSHCSDACCVMYFSNTLKDTDRKGSRFCPTCEGHLETTLKGR